MHSTGQFWHNIICHSFWRHKAVWHPANGAHLCCSGVAGSVTMKAPLKNGSCILPFFEARLKQTVLGKIAPHQWQPTIRHVFTPSWLVFIIAISPSPTKPEFEVLKLGSCGAGGCRCRIARGRSATPTTRMIDIIQLNSHQKGCFPLAL